MTTADGQENRDQAGSVLIGAGPMEFRKNQKGVRFSFTRSWPQGGETEKSGHFSVADNERHRGVHQDPGPVRRCPAPGRRAGSAPFSQPDEGQAGGTGESKRVSHNRSPLCETLAEWSSP